MRKALLLMLGMLAICSQLWAQRTVTGRITDDKGAPVPNASVVVKGTTQGTVTNSEGYYTLTVPANGRTLVFSSVDMGTREVNIGSQTTVDVSLLSSNQNLEEVVVVGYGTQRRSEMTGSVAKISGRQIENLPIISPDQALQGRAAGVTVTQSSGTPGASINVNIRGVGSISGATQPLYIVDGIPVSIGSYSQIGTGGQTLNSLADINPNDIESFEILKDASSTAVYGARAANGVVLITTKRGKNQKTKINYGTSYGFQNSWKRIETLTGPEQIELVQEGFMNRFGIPLTNSILPGYGNAPSSYPTTVWQNEIFRQAPIQQHDISAAGGNDKTKFFIGGGYFDQEGIILGSEFKRYNFRANVDNNVSDKFKISSGLSISRSSNSRIQNDNNIYGVLSTAVLSSPHIPVFNADGSYARDPLNSIENPVASAKEIFNRTRNNRVLANLSGEYQIIPSLSFRANFGADYVILNELNHFPTTTNAGSGVGGTATEAYNQSLNLVNENILTFKKRFGNDHDLTAIGVASFQQTRFESIFGTAQQFPTNSVRRLSAGAVKTTVSSDENGQGIIGYVARVNYGYKGKYLASASIRRDGASNFGKNQQWGTFPAVSAAWRISEEKFMDGIRAINELKVRASYGIVGNAGLGLFPGRALVGTGASYQQQGGLAPIQLGNPDLRWEKSEQTDIAVEIGLFNRINLTVEAYLRNTGDLLQSRPLVGSSGFTGINSNVGALENKGLEFTLSTQNIRRKDFTWNTDFNITFQRNVIKKLIDGTPFPAGFASWVQEGQAIGSFRGFRVAGIFQTQAEITGAPVQTSATRPGDLRFVDLNGDNRITAEDQEILGNAQPKFFGGLTNNISFKNFQVSAFVQFVSGNKIYNNTRAFAEGMNSIFGQFATTRNRWRPNKTDGTLPRAVFGDPNNNRRTSDRFLEDGSYARLKNVVVSYNVPTTIMSRLKVTSLKFFVQGQNLVTLTNYSGFDPEVSTFSVTNTAPGTDFLTFPQARTITFGLNLGF